MSVPGEIDVSVLGSLEVRRAGMPVAVPGSKPRAVLTMLGLSAGRPVAADVIAATLWGDRPPRTAVKALQTHVSVLRRALGPVVVTRGPGWLLDVGATDATRFEAAMRAGRNALRIGDPATALRQLETAADLWRGAPELPPTPRAQAELTRWVEAYESLVEDVIEARLATGNASELIGELETAVTRAPLRERRWAQLALALYRSGRQGDALRAYQRARAVLAEELGVEPGAELRQLEQAMLTHDPRLDRGEDAPTRPAGPDLGGLPVPPTMFVGRDDELAALRQLVGTHPLVIVTGPGGVGKTRLALAVAATAAIDFPGGAVFVDLAPATADLVPQSVAAALAVTEHRRRPLEDAIHDRLRQHRTLLLLDNCEHVVDAAGLFVSRLVRACPGVAVLATSRERLGVGGEHVFAVPPMSLVGPGTGGPEGSEAETLFLDRARAADSQFYGDPELIGEICRRLDGIPLAIELAAARCASIGVDGLLAGLDDRLGLLTGARGAEGRHRSLRAVLDWSHDLLDSAERAVFRGLGVFVGGFDLTAAAAVIGAPGPRLVHLIGRLTDKSLLVHERRDAGSRWRLLDVVRGYANEQLTASGDEPAVHGRYLDWAAATAAELERRLQQGEPWQDAFHPVADDLRAALLGGRPEHPDGIPPPDGRRLTLALSLAHLYARCGSFTAAQFVYEQAMTMARESGDAGQLALAALGASTPGMLFGVTQRGRVALLEEALGAQPAEPSGPQVQLMARLATELYWSGDRARSLELGGRAMAAAQRLADDDSLAHALYAQHYVTRRAGEASGRLALADRLIGAAHRAGNTQLELAGRAARIADLLENADVRGMDAELHSLAERADHLGHPEFQWYAVVYRLVRALIDGRFDDADKLAEVAEAAAATRAPELAVGLYFAQAVTDLREPGEIGRPPRSAQLGETAARFPRVFVWRCAALAEALRAGLPASSAQGELHKQARELMAELGGQPVPDGHWLVGSCLLAEAVAELKDRELAMRLTDALRPYAGKVAVAGRVAAFRGSVSHPLGLLELILGNAETAVDDLTSAAHLHERMGAHPFQARSLVALAHALEARGAAGDRDRAADARRRAADLAGRLGMGGRWA